jgi:hypothetical protein
VNGHPAAHACAQGALSRLLTVLEGSHQTVNPKTSGTSSFDPGTSSFGLYAQFPKYDNKVVYSEDKRNTWGTSAAAKGRFLRFYPLRNADGSYVPNA